MARNGGTKGRLGLGGLTSFGRILPVGKGTIFVDHSYQEHCRFTWFLFRSFRLAADVSDMHLEVPVVVAVVRAVVCVHEECEYCLNEA